MKVNVAQLVMQTLLFAQAAASIAAAVPPAEQFGSSEGVLIAG